MFLILRLLGLRARRPEVFESGAYRPLEAGPDVCAFLRGEEVAVAVAVSDEPPADSVELPAGRWRDVLHGEERRLGESVLATELLDAQGIAVLEREDA